MAGFWSAVCASEHGGQEGLVASTTLPRLDVAWRLPAGLAFGSVGEGLRSLTGLTDESSNFFLAAPPLLGLSGGVAGGGAP